MHIPWGRSDRDRVGEVCDVPEVHSVGVEYQVKRVNDPSIESKKRDGKTRLSIWVKVARLLCNASKNLTNWHSTVYD